MKYLFLLCAASHLLSYSTSHAQTLQKIKIAYQKQDSLFAQEKVYAHTDRTLYKPGDNIWFNVFVTNAQNCPSIKSELVYAELLDPKGNIIKRLQLPNQNGNATGCFLLNVNDIGGIYKLRVYSYWMQNFSKEDYFEKSLTIQKSSIPELLMKMDFEREAYGAGDKVVATFEARTKNNKPLAGKNLTFTVQVGGAFLCKETAVTDENGAALLVYELPKNLNTRDNLVNVQLDNDGLTESIARSAPIVLNHLDIHLLPEGGNIIVGFKNRVAVKVLNEFGKPADIKAQIVNQEGAVVSSFETYHQGMGAFEFVPTKNERYHLQVLNPIGIQQIWNLPAADEGKIGLYLKKNNESSMDLDLYSPKSQEINILAQQQGRLIYSKTITANQGKNFIQIPTQNLPIGIVQITVLDAQQQPHAERLVFINKHRKLKVEIKSDKPTYAPREEVKMDITVLDEKGKGVQGNFSMAVVDDKQHIFADDKQDNILSYLLMTTELKGEVYEPNFYFDPKEEKAATALDYVMLTHGWRRWDWNHILDDNHNVAIQYPIQNKEISGLFTIADSLIQNQTIYLAEKQPCYSSKEAKATVKTDENGFFQFKNIPIQFPAFLCVKYHGEEFAVRIYGYSKNGIAKEIVEPYLYKKDIIERGYYKSKDGNLYDRNRMRVDVIAGDIVGQDGVYITEVKKFFIDKEGCIRDKTDNSLVRIDEEGYVFSKWELLSKKQINNSSSRASIAFGVGNNFGGLAENEMHFYSESEMRDFVEENLSEKLKNDNNTIYSDIKPRLSTGLSEIAHPAVLDANFPIQPADMTDEDYVEHLRELAEEGKLRLPADKNIAKNNTEIIDYGGITPEEIANLSESEMRALVEENLRRKLENGNYTAYPGAGLGIDEEAIRREIEERKRAEYALKLAEIDESTTSLRNNNNKMASDAIKDAKRRAKIKLYLRQLGLQLQNNSIVPKFYEPNYKTYQNTTQRSDFRKTIYWNPNIQTNDRGQASITYYNSDEITTFRAILEGNSKTGQIAHQEYTYNAVLPFSITTKIPTVLSFGDTLRIPVVLKNNTPAALTGQLNVSITKQLELLSPIEIIADMTIPADTHIVVYLDYKVGFEKGNGIFQISFTANGLQDAIKQNISITPKGFPITWAMGGQELEKADTFILKGVYDGSLESELNIYPDILDGMMDGVESILRSPSGCFEQVSSSNYPNILALQLMEQTQYIKPDVRKKALDYLNIGYRKLVAYEVIGGGFEWFGHSPAHEGLTAYGLVQFKDMEKVYDGVDHKIIERTKNYLLGRRDGNGGFKQNVGGYDSFRGNRSAVFNAYITWALSETNTEGIENEIAAMTQEAIQSEDLYRMSLAALTHFNTKNTKTAEGLTASIQTIIKKIGIKNVKAESSVTYSYGDGLNIETLSFAALTMMQSSQKDEELLLNIVKHILSQRQHGRFGSTQSTVMALKALSAYQQLAQTIKEDGKVLVTINGKLVLEQDYKKGDKGKITAKNLHQHFAEGQNIVQVKFQGVQKALPYSLDVNWTAKTPKSHRLCPFYLETTLKNTNAQVGETVRLEVELRNLYNANLPATMAIIGIPAGLSLQAWQLKEMQENQEFALYELKDNYLILYYREFDAKEQKILSFDLKTEVGGVYTAPANVAYLYYAEEYRYWSDGVRVAVK